MRLAALWCWYHGGAFRGYQSQPEGPTVQDEILAAFRSAGLERNPVPSGRTDAGVHARMQVLSMRVPLDEDPRTVAPRLAPHLGPHLGTVLSRPAPPRFHAQVSAVSKEYRYRIALDDEPAWSPFAWRVDVPLEPLAAALALMPGERDYAAFHDASSTVRTRTLSDVRLQRVEGGVWEVVVVGKRFAKYMVRRLVSAAVHVARGDFGLDSLDVLDRALRGEGVLPRPDRAPAHGLTLWSVGYPLESDPFSAADRAEAPSLPRAPPFLP